MKKRHDKHIRLYWPLGIAALSCLLFGNMMTSCSSSEEISEPEPAQRSQLFFNIKTDGETMRPNSTRGLPTEVLTENVGLYSFVYSTWYSNTLPDMVNEELVEQGDKWITVNSIDVPAAGRKMRFYAYYPFQDDPDSGVDVSDETHGGVPTMDYDVPLEIADQYDIMMGKSEEAATDTAGQMEHPISLTISHRLSCIIFTAGTFPDNGRITKIRLVNIVGKGSIRMEKDATWVLSTDPADLRTYEEEMDYAVDMTPDDPDNPDVITVGEAAFLLLPQTTASNARIEIEYEREGTTAPVTLSKTIGGLQWNPGMKIYYNISISGLLDLLVKTDIEPWGNGGDITSEMEEGSSIAPTTNIESWGNGETPSPIDNGNNDGSEE